VTLACGQKKTTYSGLNLTPSTDERKEGRMYSGAIFKFVYHNRLIFIACYGNTKSCTPMSHTLVSYVVRQESNETGAIFFLFNISL